MNPNTTITDKDKKIFETTLGNFLKNSGARTVLLVDRNGFILHRAGDFKSIDAQSLAVLAVSEYASTQALARTIGEEEISAVFHQGKKNHVHISMIAKTAMIVTVFSSNITVSMVRLSAREASKTLQKAILDIASRK